MIKIGPYMPVECDSTTHQLGEAKSAQKSVYFKYFNLQSSSCTMNDTKLGERKSKRSVLRSAYATSGDASESSSSSGSSNGVPVSKPVLIGGKVKTYKKPVRAPNGMEHFKYACACGRRFRLKRDYKSHLTEKHNLNIAAKSSKQSGSHFKDCENGDKVELKTKKSTRQQTSAEKLESLRNVENNHGASQVNQPSTSTTATTSASTSTDNNNGPSMILPSLPPNCYQNEDFDQTFKVFSANQNTEQVDAIQKRVTKYKRKKNVVMPKKPDYVPKKRLLLNGVKKVVARPKKRKNSETESDILSSSSVTSEPTSAIEPARLPPSRRNRIASTAGVIHDQGMILNESKGGPVLNCYFIDALSRLVVVQEKIISIFHQTIEKHVSIEDEAAIQNPLKVFERHPIKHYSMLHSNQNLIVLNNSFFFVELWNQFMIDLKYFELSVILYFQWNDLIDKKLVQLDNIKCTTADIQYISLKSTFGVIVSWWEDMTNLIYYKFDIHSLEVQTKRCLLSVSYKVTSLSDINQSGEMLFGYSRNYVTIWNLESGLIVGRTDIECSSSFVTETKCLWAQINSRFLYIIRENEMDFDLMSINGETNECKIMRTFQKSSEEDKAISESIRVENGTMLINCLNKVLFYEIKTGRLLSQKDKQQSQYFLTPNNFLIEIDNFRVSMKNVLIFLLE